MNLVPNFSWRLDEVPSIATIANRSPLSEEALAHHLEQPVKQFVATVPMFLDRTVQRVFSGGTLLTFLQFLYDVYQEPMPVSELEPILNYPQPAVVERFQGYINQTLAGGVIRRINMMYPNTILEKIKRSKIELDWL